MVFTLTIKFPGLMIRPLSPAPTCFRFRAGPPVAGDSTMLMVLEAPRWRTQIELHVKFVRHLMKYYKNGAGNSGNTWTRKHNPRINYKMDPSKTVINTKGPTST